MSKAPLQAVYLGAMGCGYDLMTIIEVAARWKAEDRFLFQIHFAGTGPQLETLKARCEALGLLAPLPPKDTLHSHSSLTSGTRVIFHGQLQKDAVNELLLSADIALVPNRPCSLVACPYKAGEYAAAGLPMLSCLGGELHQLLRDWNTGSEYKEGDVDSLHAAFEKYLSDPALIKQQCINTRKMAEALFDRETTYPKLAEFILTNDFSRI